MRMKPSEAFAEYQRKYEADIAEAREMRRPYEEEAARLKQEQDKRREDKVKAYERMTVGETLVGEPLPIIEGPPAKVAKAEALRAALQAVDPENPRLHLMTKASLWMKTYKNGIPGAKRD